MQDPLQEEKEHQWVEKIRQGDRRAFKALFESYYEGLCRFAESQINDPEAAEGLVQDLFLDLWRRRRRWAPRGALRAYLFGAVRNKTIKRIRRRQVRRRWKRQEQEKDAPRGANPVDDFQHRELKRAMQDGVSALPERRRQVYVLSRRHGLTYREIADAMDISPKTVENQMVKALKFLRKRLNRFLPAVS